MRFYTTDTHFSFNCSFPVAIPLGYHVRMFLQPCCQNFRATFLSEIIINNRAGFKTKIFNILFHITRVTDLFHNIKIRTSIYGNDDNRVNFFR